MLYSMIICYSGDASREKYKSREKCIPLTPCSRQPELCPLSTTQYKSRTGVLTGLVRMARFRLPGARCKGYKFSKLRHIY